MVQEVEVHGITKGEFPVLWGMVALCNCQGLVHVDSIASRRVVNAKDVVERDQEVWVKVLSKRGGGLVLV